MRRAFYLIYLVLFFIPVFLTLTIIAALTTRLGCLLGGEKLFSYYPGMIWSRLTCWLALCPVRVKGGHHIDKNQAYVFVSNHQSAFDIFLIFGFLGVPVKWVMKAGLGRIPFVGAACRAAGFVFVDNSTAKAAAKTIEEANRLLQRGASVLVFPEGSRTYNGKMVRFKQGAFQMALDQRLPIIPLTVNGPFHLLPIDSFLMKRHPIELIIHPPIPTDALPKSRQQLADEAQAIVASALWDAYR